MNSGQEAFGCSTEWLYIRAAAAMHPGPQVESLKEADGHQQSACKLDQPLLKGHGYCFGGCSSLLSDLCSHMSHEGTKFW